MLAAMRAPPIRSTLRLPDDAFRANLAETIAAMEQWEVDARSGAAIEIKAHPSFWRIAVAPHAAGACPFEVVFKSDQTYSIWVAGETYEDRPFDRFDFFPMMARAIEAGRVERIRTLNALTGALEMIETRIDLEDGWSWIAERRVGAHVRRGLEASEERRVHRFLPYRR